MKASILGLAAVVILASAALAQKCSTRASAGQRGIDRIIKEVRHELVMLPYYGVFDNLAYKVAPDGSVTLLGQVTRPTLKSDAENVVKKIEGVERVDNQIKVLPVSGNDEPHPPRYL